MDAEHRHELKENDLAEAIANFGKWWNRHGLKTMVVLVVVLGTIAIVQIVRQRTRQNHETTWSELSTTSNPDVFRRRADAYDDPVARALANLWGAALYNARVSVPKAAVTNASGTPPAPRAEDRAESLEYAEAMLTKVLDDPAVPELLQLNAVLMMAAVHENRGAFDEAQATYKKVLDGAGDSGFDALASTAKRRMNLLPLLRSPVAFGPEKPMIVAPAPGLEPESQAPAPPAPEAADTSQPPPSPQKTEPTTTDAAEPVDATP